MALLSLASMNCPSHIPFSAHRNTGNNVPMRSMAVPSLRNRSHILKCTKENKPVVAPMNTAPPLVKDDTPVDPDEPPVKRSDFPADFLFGAGTSALQTEGAYRADGKGLSIWDTFSKAKNMASMDKSISSYYRYKADIQLMKDMGIKSYRFSISWPRILPKGNLHGGINQKGIDHYNDVINELIKAGIEPFVTVFHFDEPQALEDLYGGMRHRNFVNDFKDYCDICFKNFGDRVKYWTLTNEMLAFSKYGYDLGVSAPGRASVWYGCMSGDSACEPYITTHNLLLAQGAAARLYKEKYQALQQGEVGIAIVGNWFLPHSESIEDQLATERARDFNLKWFLGPLVHGEYPTSMKLLARNRLPVFTEDEKKMLKGSLDFIGINYYTTNYIKNVPFKDEAPCSYSKDSFTEGLYADSRGVKIGPEADGSAFIRIYPDGLRQILLYLREEYQNPKIIVTENGVTRSVEKSEDYATAYRDRFRIKFMKQHIHAMKQALQEGVNVKGYFYWSLLDSWEFNDGYNIRYGLNYTDFDTLEREPKMSAEWYGGKFLKE